MFLFHTTSDVTRIWWIRTVMNRLRTVGQMPRSIHLYIYVYIIMCLYVYIVRYIYVDMKIIYVCIYTHIYIYIHIYYPTFCSRWRFLDSFDSNIFWDFDSWSLWYSGLTYSSPSFLPSFLFFFLACFLVFFLSYLLIDSLIYSLIYLFT